MPNTKNRVLVVDDSASDLQVIVENLKPHFNLSIAKSGRKALDIASSENPPEVILLDVSMPEMDGYETCQQLKANPETKDIDVIFVSANDTTDEKLKGYDVGACDYLIKPVQPEELLQKVRITVNARHRHQTKSEESRSAMSAAMSAIQEASEQSIIINFLRQSYNTVDTLDLAELIVETGKNFGLSSIAQIRMSEENVNVSSAGAMSSLEKELLYRLKDVGRMVQKGNRLILNFENITQIVKDMPADEEKAGRLRDHLMLVLESASHQYKTLVLSSDIRTLINDFRGSLYSIADLQKRQKLESINILDSMMEEVNVEFLSCGLTEKQENAILNIISQAVEAGLANFERGMKMDEELQQLAERIVEKVNLSISSKEKIETVELF